VSTSHGDGILHGDKIPYGDGFYLRQLFSAHDNGFLQHDCYFHGGTSSSSLPKGTEAKYGEESQTL
jgi:hypothetical protein